MSLIDKIMNVMTTQRLVTFGIGIAITFVIGTSKGTLDHSQHVTNQYFCHQSLAFHYPEKPLGL